MALLSVKHMTKPESFQFHWVYVSERDMMSLELGWQGEQTNRKLLNRFKCQMRCRVVSCRICVYGIEIGTYGIKGIYFS